MKTKFVLSVLNTYCRITYQQESQTLTNLTFRK